MTALSTHRSPIRYGLLTLGLLFIFTPSINLFDLLPDFIGYFMIAQAIATASDLTPYFEDARERFQKLLWISASKLVAIVIMMTIYSGDLNQRAIITVFAIGYAIVESIYLLPAFGMLFEGFFYLGVRFGCDAAIERDEKCSPDRLASLTTFFLILRALGSCLPEIALVPISEGDEQALARVMLRAYPVFLAIAFVAVLVAGMILIHKLSYYFKRMKRDGAVDAKLLQLANERKDLLYRRREKRMIRFSSILLVCAALFGIDPVFDQVNLIPDFLSGICLIAFFIVIGRRSRIARLGTVVAGIYTVISIVAHTFSLSYFNRFSILELYANDPDAVSEYGVYLTISGVELVASLLVSILLGLVLIGLVPHVAGSIGEKGSRQTARLHRSMRLESLLLILFRSLAAFAWLVYLYYSQFAKSIPLDPGFMGGAISSNVPLIDGLWLVPPLLSIVELGIALHLTSRFRTEGDLTYSEL